MCKCRECGEEFKKGKSQEQMFCSNACRSSWNNRRKNRGADVYDLFMTMRFDRSNAKGVWATMCRMASEWNEEDKKAFMTEEEIKTNVSKPGRKSFAPVRTVMERNVRFQAVKGRVSKR